MGVSDWINRGRTEPLRITIYVFISIRYIKKEVFMENVPSTAIIAVVAIVLACLLAAWGFSVVTAQRQQGNKAVQNVEQMNAALDESKFTVYEGATVTGSQVIAAITTLKDQPVAIAVNNGKETKSYIYTGLSETAESYTLATKRTAKEFSDDMVKMQDATQQDYFITPSAQFIGAVVRDPNTQAITGVIFKPVNSTSTP